MKNKKVLMTSLLAMAGTVLLAAALPGRAVYAFDDFVDGDGNTHYGWSLVANETNSTIWDFDEETGMVYYCRAAEGDTSAQRVYNYALRNLEIEEDDSYSVSCTFTPDPDSDLSVERSYGIVAWYQDADNYLIYWLQQKTTSDWSGQFYGRIDGAFRSMYVPKEHCSGAIPYCDYWRKGEYYDMWWDQANDTNPELFGQKNILLTKTVTLKVESNIEDVVVNSETVNCRKFVLHQIVDNASGEPVDFISDVFYIRQLVPGMGNFYTGIYSECFSVGLSNFALTTTTTDFAENVTSLISALPSSVESAVDISKIIEARNAYKGLLDFQDGFPAESLSALEQAESNAAAYVDAVIAALDNTKSTFPTDVDNAYNLYAGLNPEIQNKVTKLDALINAVKEAKDWTDPSSSSEEVPSSSEQPASSETPISEDPVTSQDSEKPSSGGGCGGAIMATAGTSLALVALGGGLALLAAKRRKEDK